VCDQGQAGTNVGQSAPDRRRGATGLRANAGRACWIVPVGNGLRRGASLALFTKFYHQAENDGSKLVYSVEIVEGMGRGNQA
jgi:hypothetical protein